MAAYVKTLINDTLILTVFWVGILVGAISLRLQPFAILSRLGVFVFFRSSVRVGYSILATFPNSRKYSQALLPNLLMAGGGGHCFLPGRHHVLGV